MGTGDPTGHPYPRVYGYGVNPHPLVNMGDPTRLFFRLGSGYGIVIPVGIYALSSLVVTHMDHPLGPPLAQ
jgi:hypothetical protein